MLHLLPILLACRSGGDDLARDAVRVSMSLRGLHPSPAEVDALLAGDVSLRALADRWARDPAFGATVRDLHAEQLLVRFETEPHPGPLGPLAGVPPGDLARSLDEEPLWLVERIVTEGRPYTEILTADTTVADLRVALAYGLSFDPDGPPLQEVRWPDGRPAAGILSSTGLWQRHMSSDTNFQRSRAHLLLSRLLCRSLDANGDGVRFPSVQPDAVRDDPACAACHEVLDPVASAFFGLRRYVLAGEVREAYAEGCPPGADCYPLAFWDPSAADGWRAAGMPAPAWDGVPVDGLAALARRAAVDEDFASCTARRVARYVTRSEAQDPGAVARWGERFAGGGHDLRALAVDVATDPGFLEAPPVLARPEQLERLLAQLTGQAFDARPGDGWGVVGLLTSDEHGMRSLAGGLDGWSSVRPDHAPSPTRELTYDWAASEAAAGVVAREGLGRVQADDEVRDLLLDLTRRWHADPEPDVGPAEDLFRDALARHGDASRAWTVVLTALLLDDRVVTY